MSNDFINLEFADNNREDFRLRYISISKYEGDWHSHPHTHQFSELFYILHGEGVFYIEDNRISVKQDDLIIINPNVEHTEKTFSDNPMEYIVFGVDGLAFSFTNPEQDSIKGYSFYSYGSDKNQFINFAQLMMREFQDKNQALRKSVTDFFRFFWYIFPGSRICPLFQTLPSSFPGNVPSPSVTLM